MQFQLVHLLAVAQAVSGLTITIDYEHASEDIAIFGSFIQTASLDDSQKGLFTAAVANYAAEYASLGSLADQYIATTITDFGVNFLQAQEEVTSDTASYATASSVNSTAPVETSSAAVTLAVANLTVVSLSSASLNLTTTVASETSGNATTSGESSSHITGAAETTSHGSANATSTHSAGSTKSGSSSSSSKAGAEIAAYSSSFLLTVGALIALL